MNEALKQILDEVDPDIRDLMTETSGEVKDRDAGVYWRNYQLMYDPELVALKWQEMRDRKHTNYGGKPTK